MKLRVSVVLALALTFGSEASAQWSAPSFMPPRPSDDVGIYLSSIDNFGVQGIWRQRGNLNLGVRVGWIDSPDQGGIVTAAETWGLLLQAGQGLPLDAAWTLGAGAVFDGGTSLEIPAGLTVGRTVALAPVTLQLYAHPRLALIMRTGDDDDPDDTEIGGLFDLGADVVTAGGLTLRFGTTLGSFDALGLGVAMRWGRTAVVR
jgi:hypothetical protein